MAWRSATTVPGQEALPGSPAAVLPTRHGGLRMRPKRPARSFFAALVVAAAVVAALALYTKIGDRSEVLVVTRTVLAGDQIRDDDLRVVSISSDADLPAVPATARSQIVGLYAKVRIIEGGLVAAESLQDRPLVAEGRVLSGVTIPVGVIPVGLREQSRVALVVTPGNELAELIGAAPRLVEATVSAVPAHLAELVGSDAGPRASVSLSVEIFPSDVELVGSAKAVSVHVLAVDAPFPTAVSELGVVDDVTGSTAPAATAPTSTVAAAAAPAESAAPSTPGGG